MAKYIPIEQQPEENIRKEIDNAFVQWEDIKANGCSDPFWPDGTNMNLVRNHIIYYYRILSERQQQISIFDSVSQTKDRPVPPKVSDNWMSPTGKHPDRLLNNMNTISYSID